MNNEFYFLILNYFALVKFNNIIGKEIGINSLHTNKINSYGNFSLRL